MDQIISVTHSVLFIFASLCHTVVLLQHWSNVGGDGRLKVQRLTDSQVASYNFQSYKLQGIGNWKYLGEEHQGKRYRALLAKTNVQTVTERNICTKFVEDRSKVTTSKAQLHARIGFVIKVFKNAQNVFWESGSLLISWSWV